MQIQSWLNSLFSKSQRRHSTRPVRRALNHRGPQQIEFLEDRALLTTPVISFDFTTFAGAVDEGRTIFGGPVGDASPATIIYYGEGEFTDLAGLPNTLGAVNGDLSQLTFSFGSMDASNHVEVVSLSEFDDGLSDGIANQNYEPNGALAVGGTKSDNPEFQLFNGNELVVTGTVERVNLEITAQQVTSSPLTVVQFDAAPPAGADPTIYNELVAVTENAQGEFRFSLNNFNFTGQVAGFGDVERFISTGQSLLAVDQVDYGDAPDEYGTTLASDGARHAVNTNLSLGRLVDGDTNGLPGSSAEDDDLNGVDDEDGVASDLTFAKGSNPTVALSVSNLLNSPGTLYGWIDYNGDGTFDASERSTVPVAAGTQDTYELTFAQIPENAVNETYARFRLSTDAAAASPTGLAADGEVEDYPVTIRNAASFVLTETDGQTTVSETGTQDEFTVVLESEPIIGGVVFSVTSDNQDEASVSPRTLTFTRGNWDQPQTVTVTGEDDQMADGDQTTNVVVAVIPDASNDEFDNLPDQAVSVLVQDDESGSLIVDRESVDVSESGDTDQFSVSLSIQPMLPVVVTVTSDNTDEGTVTPSSLTIAPEDWNVPQTVVVTGIDDDTVDGNQSFSITVSVDPDNSDNTFDNATDEIIDGRNVDNDQPGFSLSAESLSVSETGTTDVFEVVLTSAPATDVVFDISSGDVSEADVSPASLTFNPTDWNSPQSVTVTGVDDEDTDGDQSTVVTVSVNETSDSEFTVLADQTLTAVTVDDDTVAGIELSKLRTTVAETDLTDFFTVVLTAAPESSVVIDAVIADDTQASLNPIALTFTANDWNVPQQISVAGVDDQVDDGTQVTSINVSVNDDESDAAYAQVADQTVEVVVTEEVEFVVDIDGDSELQPLTDGILAIRFPREFFRPALNRKRNQ